MRRKILIVDDEQDLVEMMSYLLRSEGYETECALNGHEMLERLAGSRPDLILLDYMMPAFNGVEALTAAAGRPFMRGLPVILMSASKEPKFEGRLWTDFLPKPFDIEVLLRKVRQHLPADAHARA